MLGRPGARINGAGPPPRTARRYGARDRGGDDFGKYTQLISGSLPVKHRSRQICLKIGRRNTAQANCHRTLLTRPPHRPCRCHKVGLVLKPQPRMVRRNHILGQRLPSRQLLLVPASFSLKSDWLALRSITAGTPLDSELTDIVPVKTTKTSLFESLSNPARTTKQVDSGEHGPFECLLKMRFHLLLHGRDLRTQVKRAQNHAAVDFPRIRTRNGKFYNMKQIKANTFCAPPLGGLGARPAYACWGASAPFCGLSASGRTPIVAAAGTSPPLLERRKLILLVDFRRESDGLRHGPTLTDEGWGTRKSQQQIPRSPRRPRDDTLPAMMRDYWSW